MLPNMVIISSMLGCSSNFMESMWVIPASSTWCLPLFPASSMATDPLVPWLFPQSTLLLQSYLSAYLTPCPRRVFFFDREILLVHHTFSDPSTLRRALCCPRDDSLSSILSPDLRHDLFVSGGLMHREASVGWVPDLLIAAWSLAGAWHLTETQRSLQNWIDMG